MNHFDLESNSCRVLFHFNKMRQYYQVSSVNIEGGTRRYNSISPVIETVVNQRRSIKIGEVGAVTRIWTFISNLLAHAARTPR